MDADIIEADPTEHPGDFDRVIEAVRAPVLVRHVGSENLRQVLKNSVALMAQGANGMVGGRNINQHHNQKAVVSVLMAMVHRARTAKKHGTSATVADNGHICWGSTPASP